VPVQRSLTPRQQQILRSVARGKTNKDIAAELGISEQGVKVHISRLLERYGALNRVELVNLTRAWPDAEDRELAAVSADIAGTRAGLNRTYDDVNAFGEARAGDGHVRSTILRAKTNGHPQITMTLADLAAEVRSLREVLSEINVALKLARELPAETDAGPIVDAIRARVSAALEKSVALDAMVDRERALGKRTPTAI
jgi:DNA-binding CsgD family transcriptional regulator